MLQDAYQVSLNAIKSIDAKSKNTDVLLMLTRRIFQSTNIAGLK